MKITYKGGFVIFASITVGLIVYKNCKSETSQPIPITYDKAHVEPLYGFSEADKERFKKKEVVFKKVGEMKNPSIDLYNCFGGGWENDPGDFLRINIKLKRGRVVEYDNNEGWIKILEKSGKLSRATVDRLKIPANSTKIKTHPYGVTLDMSNGDQILMLFGFPYNSDPAGLLTLIYVGKDTAEMVFNKHVNLLEITETANGYQLKGVLDHGEVIKDSPVRRVSYPGQRCELLIENGKLSFKKFPRFDRNALSLPLQYQKEYVNKAKGFSKFYDEKQGSIHYETVGRIPELLAEITQYFGEGWDPQLGDFSFIEFEFPTGFRAMFENFDQGWSKPNPQIKLPPQSAKVVKNEYGIILDIGGGNHILALTGYKYTQESSFLTLICVTPDNADMVFNKKVELLEVQEISKGYRLLGQLPATQQEKVGQLCEICIDEGELKFKEL